MYLYRSNCCSILRNLPKRSNLFPSKRSPADNRTFYSATLDNRLKSSLESVKFVRTLNSTSFLPRLDQLNSSFTRFNISFSLQSSSFSTCSIASSNTVELSSEDEVPEMTDDAIAAEPTRKRKSKDEVATFKGAPLLGKETGSVYTKHEPTMFGDWSHMGRVTDF